MSYRFGPDASVEEVHASLDQHGVAIVESFLAPERVARLRADVDRLLARDLAKGMKQQFDEVFTESRKIRWTGFDWAPYDGVRATVGDPLVADVLARRRYESDDFPEFIIAQHSRGRFDEVASLPPQFSMHTDGIQAHRFMYYLTDVGPEDGPLTVVPGAYPEYRDWRDEQRARGHKAGTRYRLLPELEGQGIPMTGPAGTLVTFFTDSPHKAGIVQKGHERVVFRMNAGNFAVQPFEKKRSLGGSLRRLLNG